MEQTLQTKQLGARMKIRALPTLSQNPELENRGMLSHSELMEKATEEKGSPLTKVEEFFVWVHPTMTFDEIREMLDDETKL